MDDLYEITLKNVCCTCLSTDRRLSQLCRVDNGVNDLFCLLSYKSEAYEAIFVKDVTQLYICWECRALMLRHSKFREQACLAQAKLTDIADGKINLSKIKCLSKLSNSHQDYSDQDLSIKVEALENFVDCGPDIVDIKIESDNDDVPLAQLSDLKTLCRDEDKDDSFNTRKPKNNKRRSKTRNNLCVDIPILNNCTIDTSYENRVGDIAIRKSKSNKTVKSEDAMSDAACSGNELNDSFNTSDTSDGDSLDSVDIMVTKNKKKVRRKDSATYNVVIPIANGGFKSKQEFNETDLKINKGNLEIRKSKCDKNKVVNNKICKDKYPEFHKCYDVILMNGEEMLKSIDERKFEAFYVNALNKCEACIEVFENCDTLEKHISDLHEPKQNHAQCNICQIYVERDALEDHIKMHYVKYKCRVCEQMCYDTRSTANHLRTRHYMQESYIEEQMRKISEDRQMKIRLISPVHHKSLQLEPSKSTSPDSGMGKLKIMIDDPKGLGFACVECNKYFKSKNLRNKHVQKFHREGYQCPTCGKIFPFSTSLKRHEMIHCSPLPRQQCAVCGRMVRADLARTHARLHARRGLYPCTACDKKYASRTSYENHLKYSRGHADRAALKYKCSTCGKDYRSPGELRDHYNYTHMGKTHHKCPICDKALASRRCVTRHVRRAHQGVKENVRDKICQTCGKGFTCSKSLQEHELRHTGERPLSCDICARTFRQKASLYTHKRRVHKVALKKKLVHHTDDIVVVTSEINKNTH